MAAVPTPPAVAAVGAQHAAPLPNLTLHATPIRETTRQFGNAKILASPLLAPGYFYTDPFNTFPSSNYWHSSYDAANGVTFVASGGVLNASRYPEIREDDNLAPEASLVLKQYANFSGPSGTNIKWRMGINKGAKQMIMDAYAVGRGDRYLSIHCFVTDVNDDSLDCKLRLRDATPPKHEIYLEAPLERHISRGLHDFEMRYVDNNSVQVFVDGDRRAELLNIPDAHWNDLAWVQPRWEVFGRDGHSYIIDASLDEFSMTGATDAGAPTITLSGGPPVNQWYQATQDATISYSAGDDGSGIKCLKAQWGTAPSGNDCFTTSGSTTTSHTGSRTLYLRAWDWAGNQTTDTRTYRRDPSPPSGTLDGVPGSWQNAATTVTVTGSDSGGSGLKQVRCRVAGAAWSGWQPSGTCSRTFNSQGTFEWEAEDKTGNSANGSQPVRVDRTQPTVTWGGLPGGWQNTPATVTLTPNDSGGSGLKRFRCKMTGAWGSWQTSGTCSDTFTAQGTFEWQAEDNAGNSVSGSQLVRVDRIKPTGSVSGLPTGWQNTPATVTVTGSDSGGSGLRRVQCKMNDQAWSGWQTGSTCSHTFNAPGRFYWQTQDNAGNTVDNGSTGQYVNWIDLTPPTFPQGYPSLDLSTISPARGAQTTLTFRVTEDNPAGWTVAAKNSSDQLVYTFSGSYQNNTGVSHTWDGRDDAGQIVPDGVYTLEVVAADRAGNIVRATLPLTIDGTAPGLSLTSPERDAKRSDNRFWLAGRVGDSGSGPGGLTFRLLESGVFGQIDLTGSTTGDFSRSLPDALQPGPNTLVITATDRVDNLTLFTRTIILDQSGPSLLTQTPAPSLTLSDLQPLIAADFSEPVDLSQTVVMLNGVLITPQLTVTGFHYTPPAPLTAGSYRVRVDSADAAGNTLTAGWDFTLDLGTTVSIDLPPLVNQTPLDIPLRGEPGATVVLHVNGNPLPAQPFDSEGETIFQQVNLQPGANTLSAQASDPLNHTAQAGLTLTYDPDRPAPTLSANPPVLAPGGLQPATTFRLAATPPASAPLSDWHLQVVSLTSGATVVLTQGTVLPSEVVWRGTDLSGQVVAGGDYGVTLTVSATNGLSASTPPQTVTVLDGPPAAPVITHPADNTVTKVNQIQVRGIALPGSRVTLIDSRGHLTDVVSVDASGHWQLIRSLVGGDNTLTARAGNPFGLGPASAPVTLKLHPNPPLEPPVQTLPATARNGQTVTFTGPARHNNPTEGLPTAWVSAQIYGSTVHTLTRQSGCGQNDLTCTWDGVQTLTGFSDGDWRVDFLGVDEAGLVGDGETTLRIVSPPALPRFTYPAQSLAQTDPQRSLTLQAGGYTTLHLYHNGALRLTSPQLSGSGRWQPVLNLPEGVNVLTATARSVAGLTSLPSAPLTITVDSTPPSLTLTPPAPYQNQPALSLTWAGSDSGTGVSGYHLDYRPGHSGDWVRLHRHAPKTTYSGHYDQGVHSFRVQAIDGVGLTSAWVTTVITVDTTPPSLHLERVTESSPYALVSGDTLTYGPGGSGSFSMTLTLSDSCQHYCW